jgi:hypothetical protein
VRKLLRAAQSIEFSARLYDHRLLRSVAKRWGLMLMVEPAVMDSLNFSGGIERLTSLDQAEGTFLQGDKVADGDANEEVVGSCSLARPLAIDVSPVGDPVQIDVALNRITIIASQDCEDFELLNGVDR